MRLIPRLVVLVCALALLVPTAASARESQFTLFEAPTELLSDDAGLRASTFEEIQGFGVDRLRVILYWHTVAPDADARDVPDFDERDPAQYPGFGRYDRLIAEAKARGMDVLLTVSGPVPVWATQFKTDRLTNPSPTRFERFVTAVGRRYRDTVDMWSVWNEPNHPDFLLPQYRGQRSNREAVSPGLYRRLFQAADRGLRASGNGSDRLLMGETAPRGTGRVVAPLTFLRGSLCLSSSYRKNPACKKLPADGYAHHAYTTRSGPFFRPASANDVTIGVLSRLNRALHRAGRAGAIRRNMSIYLTEFGIQSVPDQTVGVPETTQAEFRAISERLAYNNPRVAAFSQYLMRDDRPGTDARGGQTFGGFESGLRTFDGKPKRALDGFRLPMVAKKVGRERVRTYLWGLVRPATGATQVSLDFRTKGGKRWHFLKRDRTNSRGYWSTNTTHRSDRRYRVRWTTPDGTQHTGPLTRVYDR